MTDTKAHWKRRALRAEKEVEMLTNIKNFHHADYLRMCKTNSKLSTVFLEISELISATIKEEATLK